MTTPPLTRSLVVAVKSHGLARTNVVPLMTRGALTRGCRSYSDASAEVNASSEASTTETPTHEAWLFVDSVYPVKLASWDLRKYLGPLRSDYLLDRLSNILKDVKAHSFTPLELEPRIKDGGVFVRFQYSAKDPEPALQTIMDVLHEEAAKHGGFPTWKWVASGNAWLVKGTPWREDMNRWASPTVRVAFDGPDIREEQLYEILRPFGRILELTPPSGPVPAGTLRSTVINFRHINSATIARNTLHNFTVPPSPGSSNTAPTRLRMSYQQQIQAHAIRDYVSSHPKIFLPIAVFLLGTITYTIFDPVRVFMVEGKVNDWFDHRQYRLYKWLRSNTVDRFVPSISSSSSDVLSSGPPTLSSLGGGLDQGVWKERLEAEDALGRYLSDLQSTVAFVHGPPGSGKDTMIDSIIKNTHRKTVVIDVAPLLAASSDSALIAGLADLASVGLIGQKAGLSVSLPEQLSQVLNTTTSALSRTSKHHARSVKSRAAAQKAKQEREEQDRKLEERIKKGVWWDPRMSAVASGLGVVGELGVGDEMYKEEEDDDAISLRPVLSTPKEKDGEKHITEKPLDEGKSNDETTLPSTGQQNLVESAALDGMPIVVIKNFDAKAKGGSSARREELVKVVATWSAGLVEGQIAHVVVVSDNRENSKQIAKALPTKPLNIIALSDANDDVALSYVKQRLAEGRVNAAVELSKEQVGYVKRLGGRASDLESLIHKVRNGQTVEEAVEDIVARGVSELRKNAFGDDLEESKGLPWTREQAWAVMKRLAKHSEIPYHDVLVEFPFKGDEAPLREMEHADLISITTHNGRPSAIRPGKPVYRYVFQKLAQDPVFQATQDISYNQKIIATNEATIKACEEELLTLKEVEAGTAHWWGSRRAVSQREEYLLKKMRVAGEKVENLEKQVSALKKVLSKAS